jgi:large subunit ribosomal protein L4
MELSVLNKKGQDSGRKVSLNDDVFASTPNDHAIYLDVKQYLANQRQGTHKAKEKGEITGSTRKIKKQKGTGTARAGSIKSGVFRGGGRIFGPRPRNYSFKLNKKLKVVARKSALSYKVSTSNLSIIEDFSFDSPKTKEFVAILSDLKLNDSKVLFVLPTTNDSVFKSGRNLSKVSIKTADDLNTYDVLNAEKLFILEGAISRVEEILN